MNLSVTYLAKTITDKKWRLIYPMGMSTVELNQVGFNHAKKLVAEGKFIADDRDAWSEHRPSAAAENEFIEKNGYQEYRRWHLGIDADQKENTKAYYKFPYGDFVEVHQCGVVSAEVRAGQYKYFDIERAAAHLHGMIEAEASK
jgi:hypothetical protein